MKAKVFFTRNEHGEMRVGNKVVPINVDGFFISQLEKWFKETYNASVTDIYILKENEK